ncbi:MAG: hypothetical protein K6C13_01105 [Oscillospiraceae bacterium]|nr:hypothetical protein [Oscillospiraceae bacterium]
MDIRQMIEDAVNKIKNDKDLQAKFMSDPVGALEQLTGQDLPEEKLAPVIDGIKAKLTADNIGEGLSKLGGLFGGNK